MSSFCPFKLFLKFVYIKNVHYVQHTVGFLPFDHHCLLIEMFESFIFSVITDRVMFNYVIMLFVTSVLFLLALFIFYGSILFFSWCLNYFIEGHLHILIYCIPLSTASQLSRTASDSMFVI